MAFAVTQQHSDTLLLQGFGGQAVSRLQHVKVNGWANGWLRYAEPNLAERGGLSDTTTIYVIFWPQLLEYLGFVLVGATFVWLFIKREK